MPAHVASSVGLDSIFIRARESTPKRLRGSASFIQFKIIPMPPFDTILLGALSFVPPADWM